MEGHLNPHAIIVDPDNRSAGNLSLQEEDIVVYREEAKAQLRSGILATLVYPLPNGLFGRNILVPAGGSQISFIGYLVMGRPVPDPDTIFDSLAQDPILAEFPSALRSEVDPASLLPSPTPGCARDRCMQFIASADVFYHGPEPTNTACLSALTGSPPLPTTPPIDMDPASVYVVLQPIQVFNECREWIGGNIFPVTASFRSDTLSTIEFRTDAPPATKVMNFADLPCPPSDMAEFYNPKVPYSPLLKQLFNSYMHLNDSNPGQTCDQAPVRDPFVRAVRVDHVSGPKDGGDTIS
ncbi:MAG: hypothetical protein Q9219_005742 [cf. Caloplaca sp. 3 TL-2023]